LAVFRSSNILSNSNFPLIAALYQKDVEASMSVTNKLFVTTLFFIIISLLFFYFKPIDSSNEHLPTQALNNEIINIIDSEHNEKALLEETVDVLVMQTKSRAKSNVNNEVVLAQFESSWSLYLDENSEEHKYLFDKYKNSKEKIFIEGNNAYFKSETETGLEFTKITKEYRDLVLHDPFNVYGMFLKQLNELESYGDWSYDAELIIRKLFLEYFETGGYSIIAMQCREKTCLIEFNFTDFKLANNFVDNLRNNRKNCQCIPAETIWPELKQAVLKIDLI
jgi:hypothetical protein